MNRFYLLLLLLFCFFSLPSYALVRGDVCQTQPEMIINLNEMSIGSYNIWDAVYGSLEKVESLSDAVLSPEGHIFVAAELSNYPGGPIKLVLGDYDRRGRLTKEKIHQIEGLDKVVRIRTVNDGYLVLADLKQEKKFGLWLGRFDLNGNMVSSSTILDKKSNLHAHDILAMPDGDGFMLAASLEEKTLSSVPYTKMYLLDKGLKVIKDRAYLTGSENKVLSLSHIGLSEFIATGYTRTDDGRKAGWVVRLTDDANIIWQRQFSRGRSSVLNMGIEYIQDYILVAGEVSPFDGTNTGAWIMALDSDGRKVAWQRFFTSNLDMFGRDILVNYDNQISLLADGRVPLRKQKKRSVSTPMEEEEVDYVRLLTLNPRGILMNSDEYMHAAGVRAHRLIQGLNNERVMIGKTKMVYQIEGEPILHEDGSTEIPIEVKYSQDGWIGYATSLSAYNDPCVQSFSPFE